MRRSPKTQLIAAARFPGQNRDFGPALAHPLGLAAYVSGVIWVRLALTVRLNQIVGKDESLRDAYGKSLIFDYPYRAFHADGYGKDYAISNLPKGDEDENSRMYLLGCLLSFYRQCRIWREGHAAWSDFNVTRPLWVFLGKTVTGGSRADKATRSDVVRILDFLGWVLARGDRVRPMIVRLVSGDSGLINEEDADFFAGRFDDLKGEDAGALYDDICEALFHGPGQLHVVT